MSCQSYSTASTYHGSQKSNYPKAQLYDYHNNRYTNKHATNTPPLKPQQAQAVSIFSLSNMICRSIFTINKEESRPALGENEGTIIYDSLPLWGRESLLI